MSLPDHFTLLQVVPELETGGAEQTTLDIARAVVEAGGRAIVASRGGRMEARLAEVGGELAPMPAHSKNPLQMWRNTRALVDLIRRENVSLVHARSRAPAFSALAAARTTRTPFVATYHGVYKARSALKRWYNAVMTRGDFVIANSEYTRAHLLSEHGTDPAKVVAIPRGVDMSRFEPASIEPHRIAALRVRWNLPESDPRRIVLLAGRLTRIKGHPTIVEAASLLKAHGRNDFVIVFAGDDQGRAGYSQDLKTAIDAAGLQDVVRMVGHCDDMPAAFLLADLAILPTVVPEAFGRTSVEPQAMGRPVIASALGGVVETIVEGVTGWLAEPGDAHAWADALAEALDLDPAVLAEMGKAARARARRLYRVEAMAKATLDVYRQVLEARGR